MDTYPYPELNTKKLGSYFQQRVMPHRVSLLSKNMTRLAEGFQNWYQQHRATFDECELEHEWLDFLHAEFEPGLCLKMNGSKYYSQIDCFEAGMIWVAIADINRDWDDLVLNKRLLTDDFREVKELLAEYLNVMTSPRP